MKPAEHTADEPLPLRRRPKHEYVTVAARPHLDGVIERVEARSLRPRVKPRVFWRARPAGRNKSPSHLLASKADARRWIEGCQIGGDLAGFMHELAGRGRRM